MKTTYYCFATIEHVDGSIDIKRWKGTHGATKLKNAMRLHFKASPTVRSFKLGNVWSVNDGGYSVAADTFTDYQLRGGM